MLKPTSVKVKDVDGNLHEYIISRLPATVGRQVLAKYPLSNMPKLSDYGQSHDAMLLMMSYVGVPREDGEPLKLATQSLIDNHVPDGEALIRLEIEMLKYNTSFFGQGSGQSFPDFLAAKLADSLPKIMQTLTPLWQPLLEQVSQVTPNSEKK